MKTALLIITLLSSFPLFSQTNWIDERLNTAKKASYMTADEREMIYEINRLRSDPPRYAKLFIKKQYEESILMDTIAASMQYAVTTTYTEEAIKRDTVWLNPKIESKKALKSLYDTLLKMKPLRLLQPDKGIYAACLRHEKDQRPIGELNHRGTDESWPWDRIMKASPKMKFGNENLACGENNVRSIVLQLLIDAGIEGYGHRYNILNPSWTHVACRKVGPLVLSCQHWIQNFGMIKE